MAPRTTNFTAMHQAYIAARIDGLPPTRAAIHAGYAKTSAQSTSSRLEQRTDIKKAIKEGRRKVGRAKDHAKSDLDINDDKPRLKDKYECSLAFMRDAMNNPRLSDSVRFEAAKQLLPYEHGRIGEKGKKETQKDRAKEVAGGGSPQRTRLTPKKPPQLRVVS